MPKSTTRPTATRSRRITKQEANSEIQALGADIQGLLDQITALEGGPSQAGNSRHGYVVRRSEETDPVADSSRSGSYSIGDADRNTATIEREEEEERLRREEEEARGGRRVRADEEPDGDEDPTHRFDHGRAEGPPEPSEDALEEMIKDLMREDEEDDEGGDGEGKPGDQRYIVRLRRAAKSRNKKAFRTALKAIITGDPDASTASGRAEDRIDDLFEPDEENVDDVSKAIARMLLGGKGGKVRRSMVGPAGYEEEPATRMALVGIYKTLQKIAQGQSRMDRVVRVLDDGFEITKGLEEEDSRVRKAQEGRLPVGEYNSNAVLKAIYDAFASVAKGQGVQPAANPQVSFGLTDAGGAESVQKSNAEIIHENSANIALGLAGLAGSLWNQ